jgi:predicted amidohydrolase
MTATPRLKLAVVQMDCVPGDVAANLARAEALLAAAAAQGAHLAVLPELCTTGYFIGERLAELAEPVPGPTTERLGAVAARHGLYVAAGIAERGEDGFYDSAALIGADGRLLGCYRKVHLFAAEKQFFRSGERPALFDTPYGRVALTICYDLVFPEYIRALVLRGAQLILNCTDWITNEWQTGKGWSGEVVSRLAATRALENTVHVAMANRTGVEAGWRSLGYSCIAAPSGGFLARIEEGEGMAIATVALDDPDWQAWRAIASYLQDRRTDLYARLDAEHSAQA